ncbi:MAG: hypothetical protein ACREDL_21000, partial [Bradyrhizobium sp.]
MRRHVRLLIACAIVSVPFSSSLLPVAAFAGDAAPTVPLLALYGQLPSLDDPAISPTGDRLAYLVRRGEQRYVEVFDLTAGKPVAAARVEDTKVRRLFWYDDTHL